MLTNADRIYFIDPLTDPFCNHPEKILLTSAMRGDYLSRIVNTVVPVKDKKTWDMQRLWYITEDGDYVHGVPLNQQLHYYTDHALGLLPDGGWVTGQGQYNGPDSMSIMEAQRSDQMRLDVPENFDDITPTITVKEWVPAAPWAHELMPLPEDSDAVVQAKLNIAKEKHRQRKAWSELLHQAGWRDWTQHIDEVRESGHAIPQPSYGAHVTAQMFMPTGERMPVEDQLSEQTTALWNRVQEKSMGYTSRDPSMMLSIHAQFPIPVRVSNLEELDKTERDIFEAHAQSYYSDYGIRLGNHNANLVLRSASQEGIEQ